MQLMNILPFLCFSSRPQRFPGRWVVGAAAVWLIAALAACDSRRQESPDLGPDAAMEKLDLANLERLSDDVFGRMQNERRFSALAISVTHGGNVTFKKGYGYADWADKKLVDLDTLQFHIGSLTKTFFGTATAQLLERGQIDFLDDPVNKYLKRIQLKNSFGSEITNWDILTHQGGLGSAPVFVPESDDPRPIPPLPADYVASNTLSVVRDPGILSIYCNPCSATLGFMIEDITGQTLENGLRESVYQTLGITHTTLTNVVDPMGQFSA